MSATAQSRAITPAAATGQSTFSVTIPSIDPSREPGQDI
jgi:hypothetical protein